MKRRSLVRLLASASVVWPLAARTQQTVQLLRIGVLLNLAQDDPETAIRRDAFIKALNALGWREGPNLKIDYRWSMADPERIRANIAELLALGPDVILVHGAVILRPLLRATRTVPVVFVSVGDPVAGGFVESLARPGGNATGFATFEYSLGGKWGELLKQIAPSVKRVAVLRDPEGISGTGQIGALQLIAPELGLDIRPMSVRDLGTLERGLAEFSRQPNGGMIVTTSGLLQIHRGLLVALAAKHRLPAVYPYRMFASAGGLASYGPDIPYQYRLAAGYVDRILRGAKPGEMPVQQPTTFELVLNLKAAKAIGVDVPASLLARADAVIE